MSLVSTVGGRDEENQVGGAVLSAERYGGVGASHGQGRLGDSGTAAVRDSNTAGNTGVGLGLASLSSRVELLKVGRAASLDDGFSELSDDVEPGVAEILIQQDKICGDQIGHVISSSWSGGEVLWQERPLPCFKCV